MNKKHVAALIYLFLSLHVFAAGEAERSINVYSDRHYEVDSKIYQQFTDTYGIRVNLIQGASDALIHRIEVEAEKTDMDVLILTDAGRLFRAKQKELFQAIHSPEILERVAAPYKDSEQKWIALTKRARIIVFDPEVIRPDLRSYKDIPNFNEILVRSSTHIYNISLIAQLIDQYGAEETKTWVGNMVKNFARPPQGNDRDQMRALDEGRGKLAIVNSYYLGLLANSNDPHDSRIGKRLHILFPEDTHINISGIGIGAYSKHREDAELLLRFLLQKDMQEMISRENYEYPAVSDAEASEALQAWGTFTEYPIKNMDIYGELAPLATQIAEDQGWN